MNCPTTFGPVTKTVVPTHKPGRDDTTAKHYRTNCFNGRLYRTKRHESLSGFRRSRNTQVWNWSFEKPTKKELYMCNILQCFMILRMSWSWVIDPVF